MASTKTAAASRKSAIAGAPAQRGEKRRLLLGHLRRHVLPDIEAMHEQRAALVRAGRQAYPAAGSRWRRTRSRAGPGGRRIGQSTKPGRNGRLGSSARRATSAPATRGLPEEAQHEPAEREPAAAAAPPGGNRRRLVQVAAAAVAAPDHEIGNGRRRRSPARGRGTPRPARSPRPRSQPPQRHLRAWSRAAPLKPWRTAPGPARAPRRRLPCPGTRSRRRSAGRPASAWSRPAARP